MSTTKEKFGFSTLTRLLGKKNKEKNSTTVVKNGTTLINKPITPPPTAATTPTIEQTSQVIVNNNNKGPSPTQHNTISPLHGATTNAPFEQSFRITVLLPRDQLYVARLGARAKLKQLLTIVCENKLLSEDQYEFRDPVDFSQVFDLESTIGTVGLNEIRLCHKNEQKYNTNFNSDDIVKLRSQTSTNGRLSVTSSEPSSKNSLKIISKVSPYSSTNSLNSMDSSGMHANYSKTITTPTTNGIMKAPVAPMRKKRLAPRPPSQISVPESEVLSSKTNWNRPNVVSGEDHFDDISTSRSGSLQRKEFSSSTPNLNTNNGGNGVMNETNLRIYGEIDLNESTNSVDCNGNKETSQNYEKHNGNDRSISVQYNGNGNYYGSVQNFSTPRTIDKSFDSSSYLSLDSRQYDGELPKPSPRKSINNIVINKKKTSAPPPPPRTSLQQTTMTVSQPDVVPRTSVLKVETIHEATAQNRSAPSSPRTPTTPTSPTTPTNNKEMNYLNTQISNMSEAASYTSQISEASNNQSSRSASTLSLTSQNASMLEERIEDLKNIKKDNIPDLPQSEPPKLIKSISKDEETDGSIEETILVCIPAPPPTFADNIEETTMKNIVTKTLNEYENDTDLVTEAFKEIDNMVDETPDITEDIKIEETFEIQIKKTEIKEDVVIINSDIEDGYQGNKVNNTTIVDIKIDGENKEGNEKELKSSEPALNNKVIEVSSGKENKSTENVTQTISKSTKTEVINVSRTNINYSEPNELVEDLNKLNDIQTSNNEIFKKCTPKATTEKIRSSTTATTEELRSPCKTTTEESKSLTKESTTVTDLYYPSKINLRDNLSIPNLIPKPPRPSMYDNELTSPNTPPPTPLTEAPIKPKIYENRITVKMSNSSSASKFQKNIKRSDSFHTTRHYEYSEFEKNRSFDLDNRSPEDKDGRSLSFLSLLSAQREEIRTQNLLNGHNRKLENRKSTSDLRIGEFPNLQSLIVMKSILSSQSNLNKIGEDQVIDEEVSKKQPPIMAVTEVFKNNINKKDDEIPKINSSIVRLKSENGGDKIRHDSSSSDVTTTTNGGDEDESSGNGDTKKWKYQGKPNINLASWSERPTQAKDVTIKNEGDYIFGGATVKRTSSISTLQRNRMSLPAPTTTMTTVHIKSYSPTDYHQQPQLIRQNLNSTEYKPSINSRQTISSTDYQPSTISKPTIVSAEYQSSANPRQSLGEVKLRKVHEETYTSKLNNNNSNQTNNQEFPDFRSTLRKSENSARLYSTNQEEPINKTITSNNLTNGNHKELNSESELSFREKTRSFGPVVMRKTASPKETLILNSKPVTLNRESSTPTSSEPEYALIRRKSIEYKMPMKMQINERALYDDTLDDSNSNHRNSISLIRPIIVSQNGNVKRPQITSNTIAYNAAATTIPPPPPPVKPTNKIVLNTHISVNGNNGGSRADFLSEIEKFNKNNLKKV